MKKEYYLRVYEKDGEKIDVGPFDYSTVVNKIVPDLKKKKAVYQFTKLVDGNNLEEVKF